MSDFSLTLERAIELCQQYRAKNKVGMFSQCWGCLRFSKGVPEKMCFFKPPSHDGCGKVNAYAKQISNNKEV